MARTLVLARHGSGHSTRKRSPWRADKPILLVTDLWKLETTTIMPSKSDAAAWKWIEGKYHLLTKKKKQSVPTKIEEAGDILALLGKWEREHPQSQNNRTNRNPPLPHRTAKEMLAKRAEAKRVEKPKTSLTCDTAQVQAHPLLVGQQGVFAIEALRREDIAFSEVLPVVSNVPAELKGSDHYIAMHQGAGSIAAPRSKHKAVKEMFLVLKMESAAHDSMAYYLNSAGSSSNVLDPNAQGANVMLGVTVGSCAGTAHHRESWWLGRPARVTARCMRHVAAGEELLWAYDWDVEFGPPSPSRADVVESPTPAASTHVSARTANPRRGGFACVGKKGFQRGTNARRGTPGALAFGSAAQRA
jgi:hypothetical protein